MHRSEELLAVKRHGVVHAVNVFEIVGDVLEESKGRGMFSAGKMDFC